MRLSSGDASFRAQVGFQYIDELRYEGGLIIGRKTGKKFPRVLCDGFIRIEAVENCASGFATVTSGRERFKGFERIELPSVQPILSPFFERFTVIAEVGFVVRRDATGVVGVG